MPSLLIVGAGGRLGVALIRAASAHTPRPSIHAFLRTPSKLSASDASLCDSVQQGDATSKEDMTRALGATGADVVILTVGVPNNAGRTSVRTDSARALIAAVDAEGRFSGVRVAVVSSLGAGGSGMEFGWGVGTVVGWVIRHVLRDHEERERVLRAWDAQRVWTVRPSMLTAGASRGGVVRMGEGGWWCDRRELAEWMGRVCDARGAAVWGTADDVTGRR